jgi:AcrR family transcriptional regulator
MAENSRERILAAAAALFSRRGYAAVSIRDLAEEAGLSKPGLYHYFASKEELLIEILRAELEAEAPLLQALAERQEPWRERLVAWIAAILALPPERSTLIMRLGQETAHLDEDRRRSFGETYQRLFLGPLHAFLEEGADQGELTPGGADLGLWILLGALTPFLQGTRRELGGTSPESLAPLLASALLDGLGSRVPTRGA